MSEAITPEIKELSDGLRKSYEEFKSTNDRAIEEIKKRGAADVLLTEKVDRINAALDQKSDEITKELKNLKEDKEALEKEVLALKRGANVKDGKEPTEYAREFKNYLLRGGVEPTEKMREAFQSEYKTMSVGSLNDGGFLAPIEWDRTIESKLVNTTSLRSLATVVSSSSEYKKMWNSRGTNSGWVAETAARPTTNTSQVQELAVPCGEIYANPMATQKMLDDAQFDVEGFIIDEVLTEFSLQEGAKFISGTGTDQPRGLLTYATGGTSAATHPAGAVGVVNSGLAAGIAADSVINLVYSLKKQARTGASFIMNSTVLRETRKLKDSTNNYLWQPSNVAGQPSSLFGYPVNEIEDMPDVAANALCIAFGNFKMGYLVVDRYGVRTLRDPYTNKPHVTFYTTKRVGGIVQNPEYLKFYRCAV